MSEVLSDGEQNKLDYAQCIAELLTVGIGKKLFGEYRNGVMVGGCNWLNTDPV